MSEAEDQVREVLGQLPDDKQRGVLAALRAMAAVRRWPALVVSERSALEQALEWARREGYSAGLAAGRWEAGDGPG